MQRAFSGVQDWITINGADIETLKTLASQEYWISRAVSLCHSSLYDLSDGLTLRIFKELAEIFRANAKTMFNNGFITVTIVRVSSDLSSAKAYLSIMATQDVDALFKSINEQKQHIRKILGFSIGKQVRVVPELHFFIDDSYDYAEKINAILNKGI